MAEGKVTLAEAVRYSISRLAASDAARKHCPSEECRMRVHACGLRLLDSIAHCKGLFYSSDEIKTTPYNVKVISQAIYGIAFSFEDDAEVSDRRWTRRSQGICPAHVVDMECRVLQLFWKEGKGSLRPSAARF